MNRSVVVALFGGGLLLAACGQEASPEKKALPTVTTVEPGTSSPQASSPPSPPGATPSEANDGYPDMSPPVLAPEAERGVTGATNVLISWARAIELREFDQAWAMLSDADKAKWSKAEFRKLFADLDKIMVGFERGETEGAAGSSYYTAPIYVSGSDKDGRPIRYDGTATLRRVNDVDGATPAQLRWHFERVTLDWAH